MQDARVGAQGVKIISPRADKLYMGSDTARFCAFYSSSPGDPLRLAYGLTRQHVGCGLWAVDCGL
jgi:hypothetical protein